MTFKEYCKQNYKEFIFNVIFWVIFLLVNDYFMWWKGYFQCAKDNQNNKLKVELIKKTDGTEVWQKKTGWIHLK